MKKAFIAVLLLLVVATASVFAEEASTKKLFNSVQIGAGFDFFSAKGKWDDLDAQKGNSKSGFGFSLGTTMDMSAIPKFLADGWYGYFGLDIYFSGKFKFADQKYPTDIVEVKSSMGFKTHLAILYHTTLNTPLDFYFGAGFAMDNMSGTLRAMGISGISSATSWGLSIYAEGSYKLGKHFAVNVTVIPDITFVTKMQTKENVEGLKIIQKRTSFGFGIDVSAKLGVKYIL